ncbi:MAG: polymerase sigma factor RpoE [Myxococcales bacterium]|nr:polymerase sigma factor RpoE [Myxococcales bacterium]
MPRIVSADDPAPERVAPTSEELFMAHAQRVAAWVSRLAGPGADVEDLVQEVFLQAHRRLPSFRGDAKATTWLYAISERVVMAKRRKDRLRRLLTFCGDAPIEDLPAVATAESVERREAARLIYGALDRLREKYRTVFILFEVEGLSCAEIASLKGLKIGTVWVRLNRARKQMSAHIRAIEGKGSDGRQG